MSRIPQRVSQDTATKDLPRELRLVLVCASYYCIGIQQRHLGQHVGARDIYGIPRLRAMCNMIFVLPR